MTTDTTGEALVWCSVSARLLRRLPHSEGGAVFEARGFPDGDRLATIGADLTAAIWSVSSGCACGHGPTRDRRQISLSCLDLGATTRAKPDWPTGPGSNSAP